MKNILTNFSLLYIHQNKQISENNSQVKSNEFFVCFEKLDDYDFTLQTYLKIYIY